MVPFAEIVGGAQKVIAGMGCRLTRVPSDIGGNIAEHWPTSFHSHHGPQAANGIPTG